MTYYDLFWRMEDENILNVDDPVHLWALQLVFLPRLQNHLTAFLEGWNNHPLSTERNRTPHQLMLMHLPPADYDIILTQVSKFTIIFIKLLQTDVILHRRSWLMLIFIVTI